MAAGLHSSVFDQVVSGTSVDPGAVVPALVEAHRAQFPWYDSLLREQGVEGSAALEDLPLLGEPALEDYYSGDSRLPEVASYFTSGTTTGRRKRILWSADDHRRYIDARRSVFSVFLGDMGPGARAVSDLGTGHAAASAREIFVGLGFDALDIEFERPLDEHIGLLNGWQPDVLFTMPPVLDRLLAGPPSLNISPQKVIVLGDVAPVEWRRHVTTAFDLGEEAVLDVVGSIEVGAIAHLCAETGRYHLHDHLIPEVLSLADLGVDGELAPDEGVLVLTSLHRRAFPVVRYVTGDVVAGWQAIEWQGREVPTFEHISGRVLGDLKHGERVSAHDLCTAVNRVLPGAVFDVEMRGPLEIRVVADQVSDAQAEEIRGHLLSACPDIDQMQRSRLVAPIRVSAVGADEVGPMRGKRRFGLG